MKISKILKFPVEVCDDCGITAPEYEIESTTTDGDVLCLYLCWNCLGNLRMELNNLFYDQEE